MNLSFDFVSPSFNDIVKTPSFIICYLFQPYNNAAPIWRTYDEPVRVRSKSNMSVDQESSSCNQEADAMDEHNEECAHWEEHVTICNIPSV